MRHPATRVLNALVYHPDKHVAQTPAAFGLDHRELTMRTADGVDVHGWFVRADGEVLPTAISLGRRPTFYETADASLLEAHVLDFSGDLYDERVAVRFVARLRGEERFDTVEALVEQMERDCERARHLLGGA